MLGLVFHIGGWDYSESGGIAYWASVAVPMVLLSHIVADFCLNDRRKKLLNEA